MNARRTRLPPRRSRLRPAALLLALLLALLPAAAAAAGGPLPDGPRTVTAADALAAYYQGDREACLRAYGELLRRDPQDAAARRNLVRVLREDGRMREALEQLEELLGQEPAEQGLRMAAAQAALLAGEPERSLAYLQPLEPSADSLYAAALALIDLGRPEEALAALERSLEAAAFQPQAWYRLGLLRLELGAPEGAEEALRRALAQEPNLTAAFYPLARVYVAQGQLARAHGLLRRAAASLPGDPPIRELLQQLTQEHPELAEAAAQEQQARKEAAAPRRAAAIPEGAESLPAVRIGLSEGARELHLKTGGAFTLTAEMDGRTAEARGEGGTVLTARPEEAGVVVSGADGSVLLRASSAVRLRYDDAADTTVLFDIQFGRGAYWAGSEDRMYRGVIELVPRAEELTAVNELSIEEYLYSVLPSEMPSHWPPEALRAQAVAARSYTLANLGRYAARGFDLLGDVSSAAYRGMGAETQSVREAVEATRGMVLLDGEDPLAAFYSANCGGHTDTTQGAWGFVSSLRGASDSPLRQPGAPLAPEDLARWLTGRPEAFCAHPDYSSRSAYRWQLWVSREEIERRLDLGPALGRVLAVVPAGRGVSGRVREIRIRGTAGEHTLRGDAMRWKLGGLRSSLFTVEPKLGIDGLPEQFLFTGGGWGHGVGLCQSGAAGMAAAGSSAEQILHHYYAGAELRRLY